MKQDRILLEGSTFRKESATNSNNSFNKQLLKKPISKPHIAGAQTIRIANNIKCNIFKKASNTHNTTNNTLPANEKKTGDIKKKRKYCFSNYTQPQLKQEQNCDKIDFHEPNNSNLISVRCNSNNSEDQESVYGPGKTDGRFSCHCEELSLLNSGEYYHERYNSFRKNSMKSCAVGGIEYASKHHSIVSSQKNFKHKSRSTAQNSEGSPTAESTKKYFSNCSSCSSSNSCNCDITGENSNTLYDDFGVGSAVSCGYTNERVTACSGTAVSFTSATYGQGAVDIIEPNGKYNSLESPRSQRNEYLENIDKKDHDPRRNSSYNSDYFDEICSLPSLIEDLNRVETDNEIFGNNLKQISEFYEKLYKKQKRLSQLSTHCELIDGDLVSQSSYLIQDTTGKDLLDRNICSNFSKSILYVNTMNFDAGDKKDTQLVSPASSAAVVDRFPGHEEVEDCDKNELNMYGTGYIGANQNIAETMNGTTIGGVILGTGANQPKSTGGAAQKRTQRRGGKQHPDRPERALFCFTLKNPVRAFCIRIVDSKHPLKNT